jgi:N6-L-threonylcarbamoyladenine synthase
MRILAIETSCDETAAAVVEDGTNIISNVVASSSAMHEKWGGIVPEVAAREQLRCIIPVIIEALSVFPSESQKKMRQKSSALSSKLSFSQVQPYKPVIEKNIDAIAVTVGPGLIGSLLIGVETAKTMAYITGKPIIPVNHVLAHMYANFVQVQNSKFKVQKLKLNKSDLNNNTTIQQFNNSTIIFPAISLVVSGGHTELFLMTSPKDLKWLGGTTDDAAGEAFDKTARLLGFGSRGGLAIQEAAQTAGNQLPESSSNKDKNNSNRLHATGYTLPAIPSLPRPLIHDKTLNFSFSGLKTAIFREVNKLKENNQFNEKTVQQLALETQEAIADVLVSKTLKAVQIYKAKSVMISGGVAANLRLREKMKSTLQQYNNITSRPVQDKQFIDDVQIGLHVPEINLCTDNAVYIASYAYFRGRPEKWQDVTAVPDLGVEV